MSFTTPTPTSALHSTIFVIFGVTGDLASRKLLPALLALYVKKLLPQRFAIIGFSRRPFSREEFREFIRENLNIKPGQYKEEDIKHFLDHMSYEQGLFDNSGAYERLLAALNRIDRGWGQCTNKLFHLSVPPTLYEGILNQLASSGLTRPCADLTGWTRVLIEKPFGNDIHTARSLDALLGKLFKEEQIFRIDHYLAKEALQNIMAFRFANAIFEPLWCARYIDKVHIKLFEELDVADRGAFYDSLGALKDMGQNHMLMALSQIAMEEPATFEGADIRAARARVLERLEAIPAKQLSTRVVKGQYAGYRDEKGVASNSGTETYFRLEAYVKSSRWKHVPFYLENGKAMGESKTEIDIYFKHGHGLSPDGTVGESGGNVLTFRIQPDEGIKIGFFVKKPGYAFALEPKTLKFKYSDVPAFAEKPNDYERLIHDAVIGDQTLFASTAEIMASWKFVTPIVENWHSLPLVTYPKGAREVE